MQARLDILRYDKPPLIYSVIFQVGRGLELCLGRVSPPKLPHGDGTDVDVHTEQRHPKGYRCSG